MNKVRHLVVVAFITILTGCYEISFVDGPKAASNSSDQFIAVFEITLTNDFKVLKSFDVTNANYLSNIRAKKLGTSEWLPADSIELELENNASTIFEVVADVKGLSPSDKVGFSLSGFVLENGAGKQTKATTVLDYELRINDESSLFAPYYTIDVGDETEAVAISDFNGDGLKDVVTTTKDSVKVLLQDLGGNLSVADEYRFTGLRGESIAVGDFNSDGLNDFLVAFSGFGFNIYHQQVDGGFMPSLISDTRSVAVVSGDFNSDGRDDVAGIGWDNEGVAIYFQEDNGIHWINDRYSIDVEYGGNNNLSVGDINADGRDDLIVMSGQGYTFPNFSIAYQLSGGMSEPEYYDLGSNVNSSGVGTGDVNGDGYDDVVLSYGGNRPSSNIGVFLNDTNGGLLEPTSIESYDIPSALVVTDITGDTKDDVVTLHSGWLKVGTYIQDINGELIQEILYSTPYDSNYNVNSLAIDDINNDGIVDIIIGDSSEGLVILLGQ